MSAMWTEDEEYAREPNPPRVEDSHAKLAAEIAARMGFLLSRLNNLMVDSLEAELLKRELPYLSDWAARVEQLGRVTAEHDERIMHDGRPAFAWWNEIQMLRADKARVDNLTQELLDTNALLGIVRIYLEKHPETGDMVITLSRLERVKARRYTLRGLIEEMVESASKKEDAGT